MKAQALALLDRLRTAGVSPSGISADSRQIARGELFVAWPGFMTDARRYIGDAIARGAAAVLWESGDGFASGPLAVPALPVEHLRELSGYLAAEIYANPSEKLWLAGVTGTNGKTTVSQWLAQALEMLGLRCGIIGTLGSGFSGELISQANTTPDALEIQRTLAGFVAMGAETAVMEVSSIGLDQGRTNGVDFDAALFTNLSRDHLDYHASMENYATSKARLFEMPGQFVSVINVDDAFGAELARRRMDAGGELIAYTRDPARAREFPQTCTLLADRLQTTPSGFRFDLCWQNEKMEVAAELLAPFNVSNLLAVTGALLGKGVPLSAIRPAIQTLVPPEGRMQAVGGVGEPLAVIDYAHSPDALAKVLEAARETAAHREGHLICVFGCGGNRDTGKRPLMGEVAARLADRVVITSDNPRNEDPEAIIADIAAAAPGAERIVDRAQAILTAISDANANDIVLIAGKGHELYQEIRGARQPFSDLEQARAALRNWSRAEKHT